MQGKNLGQTAKKGYFTVVFLPPGPHARVRTLSIPRSLIKSVIPLLVGALFLSIYFIHEYNDVIMKAGQLQSMREELRQQKAQIQSFALNILDLKRQMFLHRDLDTKLWHLIDLAPRGRDQQMLGIGGPDELGLQTLISTGGKKLDDALKEMNQDLSLLKVAALKQETSFQMLIEYFEDRRSLYESTPSLWPVKGWVTSPFGSRISPLTDKMKFHEGIDISAQIGTPVVAPADGEVVKAGFETGYGNMVEISHGYGLKTVFGHNSQLNVTLGQHVKRGDIISYVGDTGDSTGPHLHYEVRVNNLPVNPVRYLE